MKEGISDMRSGSQLALFAALLIAVIGTFLPTAD
jgi:hypothetical protein